MYKKLNVQTHTQIDVCIETILRNQVQAGHNQVQAGHNQVKAGLWPACTWFKNVM